MRNLGFADKQELLFARVSRIVTADALVFVTEARLGVD